MERLCCPVGDGFVGLAVKDQSGRGICFDMVNGGEIFHRGSQALLEVGKFFGVESGAALDVIQYEGGVEQDHGIGPRRGCKVFLVFFDA